MKKYFVYSCGRSGSFLLHRSLQLYLFYNNLATKSSCSFGVTPTELFNQNKDECPWLVDTNENLVQVRHSPGTRKIPNEIYITCQEDLINENHFLLKNEYKAKTILEKYKDQHYFLKILSHHFIPDDDFDYLKENYQAIVLHRDLKEIIASYAISWYSNNPTHLLNGLEYQLPEPFNLDKNTVDKIKKRYDCFNQTKNKFSIYKNIEYNSIANKLPHEIGEIIFEKSSFKHEGFVRKNPYCFDNVNKIILNWNEVLDWIDNG
jgi:hypothetical protein